MSSPRLQHVQCLDTRGLHRMAYWEWGDPANPRVLVCVHGLSRQGRDFDTLARDLCHHYRVFDHLCLFLLLLVQMLVTLEQLLLTMA